MAHDLYSDDALGGLRGFYVPLAMCFVLGGLSDRVAVSDTSDRNGDSEHNSNVVHVVRLSCDMNSTAACAFWGALNPKP